MWQSIPNFQSNKFNWLLADCCSKTQRNNLTITSSFNLTWLSWNSCWIGTGRVHFWNLYIKIAISLSYNCWIFKSLFLIITFLTQPLRFIPYMARINLLQIHWSWLIFVWFPKHQLVIQYLRWLNNNELYKISIALVVRHGFTCIILPREEQIFCFIIFMCSFQLKFSLIITPKKRIDETFSIILFLIIVMRW